jgi:glycosyltransferase involved in cell wall biosynthesis
VKKIVILALHLGVGGIERVIVNISNLLCESNDVTIISAYNLKENLTSEIDTRVKIKYLLGNLKPNKEDLKKSIKSHNIFQVLKQCFISIKVLYLRKRLMIKEIKRIDADIIISTRLLFNSWLGKYAKKDIIKIAQEHNHHNNNKKFIRAVKKSLKNIDYFMPVSEELLKFYSKILENSKTKTLYIPNFINFDSKITSSLDSETILAVGRLDKIKGFYDLIETFKLVNKKYPNWTLKIAGSGSEMENLEKEISFEELNNKVFLLR